MAKDKNKQIAFLLRWEQRFREKYPVDKFEENYKVMTDDAEKIAAKGNYDKTLTDWIMSTFKDYDKKYAILQELQNLHEAV